MQNHPSLVTVIYDVSRPCNYRCVYCRNDWDDPANAGQASIGFICGIIDQIAESGAKRIIFTGGEFFLLPEWRAILGYSAGKGLKNRIISNASLITREDISFLEAHSEQINVSFHVTDRTLYREIMGVKDAVIFDHVIKAMKMISNSKIRLGLFFSPLKYNYNLLFETVRFLKNAEVHIDEFNLNRIIPTQHALEYFRKTPPLNKLEHMTLVQQVIDVRNRFGIDAYTEAYPVCFLKTFIPDEKLIKSINKPCLLGRHVIALNNDGTMKLCPATGFSISPPIKNLQSELRINFQIKQFGTDEWRNNNCRNCMDWETCLGGCHASRGELFADDSLIQYTI